MPSNVVLTTSGAKLLDLGLAKLRESEVRAGADMSALTATEPFTTAGEVLGTRPYMAPEEVEGKVTDARTDLWAVGVRAVLNGHGPARVHKRFGGEHHGRDPGARA